MTEAELRARFEELGADWEFSRAILDRLNAGTLAAPAVAVAGFPPLDGRQILDLRGEGPWTVRRTSAEAALRSLFPGEDPASVLPPGTGEEVVLDGTTLDLLGLRLSQVTAFGVLNGGMATSYADTKKNQALGQGLFSIYKADLEKMANLAAGLPKGITPAFVQGDGTPGPSYLELKLRVLAQINLAAKKAGFSGPGLQLFQMTSQATDGPLRKALAAYRSSPALADLVGHLPRLPEEAPTAVQELVGTFTSAKEGSPRRFFLTKQGGREVPYALPGGHGQNFRVLRQVYRDLRDSGYRFAYLGNVDNLGFLPSLRGLALLALSGAPAAFDFAFKTPVDVKGGVLYREPSGQLNCADIGVAIGADQVAAAEKAGTPILFNCATGLFDLDRLVHDLDRITAQLPVRLSEQDKDVGRYAQAEQVTWEVIGLLDQPLIFGIEKNRRFLAAKLLLDCLLTSGLHWDDPRFDQPDLAPFRALSAGLNAGLQALLEGPLGYRKAGAGWVPLTEAEITRRITAGGWDFLSV
jgi:hypothetical protein